MHRIFTQVLSMSLTASIAICAVLIARFLLRKAPKALSYALWAVVLFRLLCPVSLPSRLSVIPPQALVVDADSRWSDTVELKTDYEISAANPMETPAEIPMEITTETVEKALFPDLLPMLWCLGVMGMAAYGILSWLRIRVRVADAVPQERGIYLSGRIPSPFVMGIFRPRIYLPADSPRRDYILLHEQYHIARRDPLFRLLGYAALCIHWFNPAVWLAFFLALRDMEMSCDEAVIRTLGGHVRADYCTSLLEIAVGSHLPGIPLSFGADSTKTRIRNLAKVKKSGVSVIFLALILGVSLTACLATNPVKPAIPVETAPPETTAQAEPEAEVTVTEPEVTDEMLMDAWKSRSGTKFSIYTEIADVVVTTDADVPVFTYSGGEMHLPVNAGAQGVKELGLLVFLDGKPQTYRVQTPLRETHTDYRYMHVISLQNSSFHTELSFIPDVGKAGDALSMQIVAIAEPNYFLEDGRSFCMYTGMVSRSNATILMDCDSTAARNNYQSRVLSVSQTSVELTEREAAMLVDCDLSYDLPYRLTVNGQSTAPLQGHHSSGASCGTEIYDYTAHEPLEVKFEVFGDLQGEYALNLFVNNLPVSQDAVAEITMEEGKKTVVTVLLNLSDYDGSAVLYGFLSARNFEGFHGDSGAAYSLFETETCYLTSAKDLTALLREAEQNH